MAVPPSPLSPSSIQLRGYLLIRLTGLQESGLPRLALSSTLVSLANCNSRKSLVASHPRTPLSATLPPRQLSVLRAGLARARKSHEGMSVTTRTDGGVKSAGIVRSCRRRCPAVRTTRITPSRPDDLSFRLHHRRAFPWYRHIRTRAAQASIVASS